ncbi:hypothetical protein FHS85_004744 [Rhodoligotrophos appendicifer]|uniref:DUF3429 domain-containing protein n=1 Tax=Rhodoligotrophos appendicifer TaxID=987056 RepID=UPI001478ADBE|nr:DUF3429 domain-containing protein [Rhodoligotrophos appendicifer]
MQESRQFPKSALAFGCIGAIPFIGLAVAVWLVDSPEEIGAITVITLIYGAVTLAFLGGIRWGTGLGPYAADRTRSAFILSLSSLLIGGASLLLPPIPGIILLTAGFILQFGWDMATVQRALLPLWYGKLQLFLTAMVNTGLLIILARLILMAPSA